jgi:hypothetical protein
VASRTFTLLAKIIQNLANLVNFGEKEPFMKDLNPLIVNNIDRMKLFLDELVVNLHFFNYYFSIEINYLLLWSGLPKPKASKAWYHSRSMVGKRTCVSGWLSFSSEWQVGGDCGKKCECSFKSKLKLKSVSNVCSHRIQM